MKGLKWKCKQESFPRQTVFPNPSVRRPPTARTPPQRNREGLPLVPKTKGSQNPHGHILLEGQVSKRPDKSDTPTTSPSARDNQGLSGQGWSHTSPCGPLWWHSISRAGNKSRKWKWKPLSPVQLCDPVDYRVHGILQARILEWGAFPFSRRYSQPRDRTQVSHTAGRFFTTRERDSLVAQAQEYWGG